MRSFFRSFFAALVALVVFTGLAVIILFLWLTAIFSSGKTETGAKAVLVVDLSQTFREQYEDNPLADIGIEGQSDVPGVYDIVRLLAHAKNDTAIHGIFIKCGTNENGFASSEQIRDAIIDFKKSGKFVFAFGDVIPQKAYYVATAAERIYCNPKGGVDWKGFATELPFFKHSLEKLEIEPQIFYAGKFKSATEPLREEHMTDANKLQTSELLNSLYNRLMYSTAGARSLDTTALRRAVNEHSIRFAGDALKFGLVDGLRYDDEVKAEIKQKLGIDKFQKINFVALSKYADAVEYKSNGRDKISVIYAEGDIVDGKGTNEQIGGDTYRSLIRKARLDKDCKAIVIRVNSGGGSSLASENLWREITIAKKDKPVIVSFGDVAASGGYYMSCNANQIFAEPTTITGSIGVFSILPNMQNFFKNKLGVTFDGVKTAPDADELSVSKPLSPMQRQYFQAGVDSIYHDFISRVSDGRNKSIQYIDSIGQGRVWSGSAGLKLGLVDKLGGLDDAIEYAARTAHVNSYYLKEYPEQRNKIDRLVSNYSRSVKMKSIQEELGVEGLKAYSALLELHAITGITQTRLPYRIRIE